MFGIGQRLRRRFPSLFDRYSPNAHYFRSTYKERAARSAAALAAGLFQGTGPPAAGGFEPVLVVTPEEGADDVALRFFDACPRFQELYEAAKGHHDTYVQGAQIAAVAKRIQERMLAKGGEGLTLTATDAMAIHEYCAFQISLWNQTGEMCALLGGADAIAAEYALDIKHWYKSSHGLEINGQMACPLLSAMLRELRAAAAAAEQSQKNYNSRNGPRNATRKTSHFFFAHGETLLPLLSRLLVVPPAPAPDPADPSRPFRTSRLIPMSSNLLFVLYKCPSDFQVLTLHNERAVGLPACGGRLFCPLSSALSALLPPDDQCHFDQLCHSDPPSPAWATGWDAVISWEGNGYRGLISVNALLLLLLALTLLALLMSLFVSRAVKREAAP